MFTRSLWIWCESWFHGAWSAPLKTQNSLFWLVPFVLALIAEVGGYDLIFDSCCHGGSRKKGTRFWCTADWFLGLAAQCPGNNVHFHKPWTPTVVNGVVKYPTAEEAAYPELLCQRLAECFRHASVQHGVVDVQDLHQQQQADSVSLH